MSGFDRIAEQSTLQSLAARCVSSAGLAENRLPVAILLQESGEGLEDGGIVLRVMNVSVFGL